MEPCDLYSPDAFSAADHQLTIRDGAPATPGTFNCVLALAIPPGPEVGLHKSKFLGAIRTMRAMQPSSESSCGYTDTYPTQQIDTEHHLAPGCSISCGLTHDGTVGQRITCTFLPLLKLLKSSKLGEIRLKLTSTRAAPRSMEVQVKSTSTEHDNWGAWVFKYRTTVDESLIEAGHIANLPAVPVDQSFSMCSMLPPPSSLHQESLLKDCVEAYTRDCEKGVVSVYILASSHLVRPPDVVSGLTNAELRTYKFYNRRTSVGPTFVTTPYDRHDRSRSRSRSPLLLTLGSSSNNSNQMPKVRPRRA